MAVLEIEGIGLNDESVVRLRFVPKESMSKEHGFVSWPELLKLVKETGEVWEDEEDVTHLEVTEEGVRFYVTREVEG